MCNHARFAHVPFVAGHLLVTVVDQREGRPETFPREPLADLWPLSSVVLDHECDSTEHALVQTDVEVEELDLLDHRHVYFAAPFTGQGAEELDGLQVDLETVFSVAARLKRRVVPTLAILYIDLHPVEVIRGVEVLMHDVQDGGSSATSNSWD